MSAVVGVSDPLFDEVGWAYVVRAPGSELDAETLRESQQGRLANYKVPKRFIFMSELPMLPVGKADKVRLRTEARREVEQAQIRPEKAHR